MYRDIGRNNLMRRITKDLGNPISKSRIPLKSFQLEDNDVLISQNFQLDSARIYAVLSGFEINHTNLDSLHIKENL